jgi:hypothetical protein
MPGAHTDFRLPIDLGLSICTPKERPVARTPAVLSAAVLRLWPVRPIVGTDRAEQFPGCGCA